MKYFSESCLVHIWLLFPLLIAAPPPVRAPRLFGWNLPESVENVSEDGTRNFLASVSQASMHDVDEASAGSHQVPVQFSEYHDRFRAHDPTQFSFAQAQHAPFPYHFPPVHPMPVQYSNFPTMVYQPMAHPFALPAPGSALPHDMHMPPPPYPPQNIRFQAGMPAVNAQRFTQRDIAVIEAVTQGGRRTETMPISTETLRELPGSSAHEASASSTQVRVKSSNEPRIKTPASSGQEESTVPSEMSSRELGKTTRTSRSYRNRRGRVLWRLRKQFIGTDPQIGSQAVQDLELLSHSIFKVVWQPEPEIDTLIESLSAQVDEQSIPARDVGSELLSDGLEDMPDVLARTVFWNGQEVKQINYPGQDGIRALFLSLHIRPTFLKGRPPGGHLGVWEFGPSSDPNLLGLYVRGFFPFSVLNFQRLELNPMATGRNFVLWQERVKSNDVPKGLALSIVAERGKVRNAEDTEAVDSLDTPELQSLKQTGQLQKLLDMSPRLPGRYLYAYQENPETTALLKRWLSWAGLNTDGVEPIELTAEQIDELGPNIAPEYRVKKDVKVITSNGKLYMLSYFKQLPWLHSKNLLIVWKAGPPIQSKRLLIAEGIFGLNAYKWSRVTQQTVPGLFTFGFRYNELRLPLPTAPTTNL